MVTAAQFAQFALAFDEATAGEHMNHPDFRVGGRIFATIHGDERRAMVRLSPVQQRRWLADLPDVLEPANGAWGRAGCTMIVLSMVTGRSARELLLDAWQAAMAHTAGGRAAAAKKRKK